jgi:NAD+ kinase
MKRAAIISKPGRPELGSIVHELTIWLREHGYAITVDAVTSQYCDAEIVDAEELVSRKPDFVVVLGGDGTLLATARTVARADIPILGVRMRFSRLWKPSTPAAAK